ncbi:uncharacterized protein HKW66_Vig0143870 [Vigna angularis]|uniref:Uncharacterized protein n=1 Tax=Phaseolus angularis TaxID=3914 RepID=A0A8T0KC11_PHAAN|nr:uncharacterized protein HKW66_Vig0143870 [Vigna angularis]
MDRLASLVPPPTSIKPSRRDIHLNFCTDEDENMTIETTKHRLHKYYESRKGSKRVYRVKDAQNSAASMMFMTLFEADGFPMMSDGGIGRPLEFDILSYSHTFSSPRAIGRCPWRLFRVLSFPLSSLGLNVHPWCFLPFGVEEGENMHIGGVDGIWKWNWKQL